MREDRAMPIKLLHTADWQIGRRPATFEDDDALALFEARFRAVERLAALAAQEAVDAVLVAGDVFDAQGVSDKTIRRLFLALEAWSGPWLLLPGNHDAALVESVWTRAQRLGVVPAHVTLCLSTEPRLVGERLAVLPAPLLQRRTHVDLTEAFVQAQTPVNRFRIGLAHGAVQGLLPEAADSGNPIAAGRAQQAGLDYLALGDWHGTLRVDDRTWYAGTPEPDRFRANASGQALVVEIEAPGAVPVVRAVPVGQFRWRPLDLQIQVQSDVDAAIAALAEVGPEDVLQLTLQGPCNLASHQALGLAVAAAAARARALVHDLSGLRLLPTAQDIESLRADGYLGTTLEELRATLDRAHADGGADPSAGGGAGTGASPGAGAGTHAAPTEAELAREALVVLAQLLSGQQELRP